MNKQEILRKVEKMLDEASAARSWGQIQIDLKEGVPILIHRMITEKLNTAPNGGQPRDYRQR